MIGDRLDIAAAYLRAGNIVGLPTETVYGLAGNALDLGAVIKIFEAKNRPFFDPLIIHTYSVDQIDRYAILPETLEQIARDLMPGPLTLLLPKKDIIPDMITSGSERVAVRIPRHPIANQLLQILDFPLAAPSANPFGYISPTSAQHVHDQLEGKVPYVLDGGACTIGIESTIIGMEDDTLVVYRKGGMDINALSKYSEKIRINEVSSSNPAAPGMLKSHYAPSCPFILVEEWPDFDQSQSKVGVLAFDEVFPNINRSNQIQLSHSRDLNEAARNLFKSMRLLDGLRLDKIYARLVPNEGLGVAINDRLKRAAAE